MILTKKIKTRAIGKTLKYYRDKGYDVNNGDYVTVDISHLHPGCKQLVSVKCDVCGNEKEISHYVYNKSYSSYGYYSCSSKCAIEKKSKTLIKNFGVDSPFKSEEIQKKITSTIQKKFGVDNAAKSKQVKNKIKSTNLKKYGVENPMQDDNVYKKSKNTKLDRYGDENYNNRDKYKETCLDNFGVENPSQLEEIKQKKIETCLENHGVEYIFQSKEFFEKTRKTNLEKYNNENYRNIEKIKSTLMDRYGVDNPSQLEAVKQKKKETCLRNYGVEYPAQNKVIYDKMIKSGYGVKIHKNTGLYYQGSYEKDFLDYCYDNNIEVIRGEKVKYKFNNKIKYYFPDFFLVNYNLIIEIKSDYYFNKHKEQNLSKQKECINRGFEFLFIINKNYTNFNKIISSKAF